MTMPGYEGANWLEEASYDSPKFIKGNVVVVKHGGRDRYVQVVKGPSRYFANRPDMYYEGWLLVQKGDPYGEPYTVSFNEKAARLATEEEIAAKTQGRLPE